MKKTCVILLVLALLLTLWGCAAAPENNDQQNPAPPPASNVQLPAESTSEPPASSDNEADAFVPVEGTLLTESELDAFRTLLDLHSVEGNAQNWYNEVLHCVFESPETVNWKEFFYDGLTRGPEVELSEDEIAFCEQNGVPLELSVFRLPVAEMNAIAQQYFGITLDESDGIGLNMPYYEVTDSYYTAHGDTHVTFNFDLHTGVRQEDGTIYLYYHNFLYHRDESCYESYVLALCPNEDATGYYFLSNLPCEE